MDGLVECMWMNEVKVAELWKLCGEMVNSRM